MKQIFHPYWEWECYKNGMWRKETKEYEETELPKIIEFTSCHKSYGGSMLMAVKNWRYSCENFLSNLSINRRAYIGHSGCCIKFGWPEYLVRKAWGLLTDKERFLANNEADKAIRIWESDQRLKSILMGGKKNAIQMEFPILFLQK